MNQKKYQKMVLGGHRLKQVKIALKSFIKPGITLAEIDFLADNLITKFGDFPSFKTVSGYHYATCINLNQGIVHGIPNQTRIKPGDLVSVDLGLVHSGFHLDSALTLQVPPLSDSNSKFLETGKKALQNAIEQAIPNNSIYQISQAIQTTIEAKNYSVIRDLTGHGVGKELHQPPSIPCFQDDYYKKVLIKPDQALAIEVMYAMGDYRLITESDGWTISTKDGSLTALFEETVYITDSGNQILT